MNSKRIIKGKLFLAALVTMLCGMVAGGCSDDKDELAGKQYGHVQFRLYKSASYTQEETTRAGTASTRATAMGRLRLKQNQMEFQEVMPGKRPSERILCGNSGDKPLRLSALVIPKFATFRTEPEVIQPGSEADIVVTVDASLIPAGKEKTFTFPIIIEGVDARPSDRTLNIKVNYTK